MIYDAYRSALLNVLDPSELGYPRNMAVRMSLNPVGDEIFLYVPGWADRNIIYLDSSGNVRRYVFTPTAVPISVVRPMSNNYLFIESYSEMGNSFSYLINMTDLTRLSRN